MKTNQLLRSIMFSSIFIGVIAIAFSLTSNIETVSAAEDCSSLGIYASDCSPMIDAECYRWIGGQWKFEAYCTWCQGDQMPQGCTPVSCDDYREDCFRLTL